MLQNKRIIIYDEQNRSVEINGMFNTEYDGERRPGVNIFHVNGKLVDVVLKKDMPSKFKERVANYMYSKSTPNSLFWRITKDQIDEFKRRKDEIDILENMQAGSLLFTRGEYSYVICHAPIVDTSYLFRCKYFKLVIEEIQTKTIDRVDVEKLRNNAAEIGFVVDECIANKNLDRVTVKRVEHQEQILREEISREVPNIELIKKVVLTIAGLLDIVLDSIQLWNYIKIL